jgi:hypothetical protein
MRLSASNFNFYWWSLNFVQKCMYDCSNFVHSCRIFGISELPSRLPVINWCRGRQSSVQVFVEARGRKFVREMTPTVIPINLRGLVYPGFDVPIDLIENINGGNFVRNEMI